MKASPLKFHRRNAEAEIQEEKKKFLAYRNKGGAKARTRPDFGDSSSSTVINIDGDDGRQEQLAQMVIDEGTVVCVRSKASKRMLEEDKEGKGIEKMRVFEDDNETEANIIDKAVTAMQSCPSL